MNPKAKMKTAWEQCLQRLFMTKKPQASIRLSRSAKVLGSSLSLKCGHGPSPRSEKAAPLQIHEQSRKPWLWAPWKPRKLLECPECQIPPGEVGEVTALRLRPAEAKFPNSQPRNIILKWKNKWNSYKLKPTIPFPVWKGNGWEMFVDERYSGTILLRSHGKSPRKLCSESMRSEGLVHLKVPLIGSILHGAPYAIMTDVIQFLVFV